MLTATHLYELTGRLVRGILVTIILRANRAGGLGAGFHQGESMFRSVRRVMRSLVSIPVVFAGLDSGYHLYAVASDCWTTTRPTPSPHLSVWSVGRACECSG